MNVIGLSALLAACITYVVTDGSLGAAILVGVLGFFTLLAVHLRNEDDD